jgi:hypothetical protein
MTVPQLPDFVRRDVELAKRTTLALPGKAAFYAEITVPINWHNSPAAAPCAASFSGPAATWCSPATLTACCCTWRSVAATDRRGRRRLVCARRCRRELASTGQLDAGAGLAGTRKSGADPRHGRRSADPEHRRLRAGNRRSLPVARSLRHAKRQTLRLDRTACRFAYRDSVFKQQGWHLDACRVITRVTFRLPKAWQPLTAYADLAAELDRQQIARPTPGRSPQQ